MNKIKIIILLLVLGSGFLLLNLWKQNAYSKVKEKPEKILLPQPIVQSKVSVEEALLNRRSLRSYKDEALTIKEISQLLWAAQGITSDWGGRTAPSAGAKYPLEIFAVVGKVEGLDPGLYQYDTQDHSLIKRIDGDLRKDLANAALGQPCITDAPLDLVVTGVYARTMEKYGERAHRYVHIEVGHACQNIYLQAETLNLGTVIIGAFYDEKVSTVFRLKQETPLAIMPVGKKR
jgi:SagB-type dehydrogenase family enzyme